MDTPQALLMPLLSELAVLHGLESRRDEILEVFRTLTMESLARYPDGNARRRSTFTSDGLPFEVSLALGEPTGGGLRYGTEAGELTSPFPERLARSHEVTAQLLGRMGATRGQAVHQALFEAVFPREVRTTHGHRFGMWQGVVHRPGRTDTLKVYYNLRPQGPETDAALDRVLECLSSGMDTHSLREMAQWLPAGARPVFLGIDYGADGRERAKIYHRCTTAVPSASMMSLLVASGLNAHRPAEQAFFHSLPGAPGNLPARALIIHTGIDSEKQEPALGLYIPLNRYFRGDEGVHTHITRLLAELDLDGAPYEQTLRVLGARQLMQDGFRHHTLLGLSLSPRNRKVNIYLRPFIESHDD